MRGTAFPPAPAPSRFNPIVRGRMRKPHNIPLHSIIDGRNAIKMACYRDKRYTADQAMPAFPIIPQIVFQRLRYQARERLGFPTWRTTSDRPRAHSMQPWTTEARLPSSSGAMSRAFASKDHKAEVRSHGGRGTPLPQPHRERHSRPAPVRHPPLGRCSGNHTARTAHQSGRTANAEYAKTPRAPWLTIPSPAITSSATAPCPSVLRLPAASS